MWGRNGGRVNCENGEGCVGKLIWTHAISFPCSNVDESFLDLTTDVEYRICEVILK